MRFFIALLALFALANCATAAEEPTLAQVLETWRESVLLDLPGELLRSEDALLERLPALLLSGEALDLRVRARLSNSDLRGAQKLIEASTLGKGEDAYVTLAKARVALQADQLTWVIQLLKLKQDLAVITSCNDQPDAWLILGRALARSDKGSDAAHIFHEFVRRSPLHSEASSAWHFLAEHASRGQQSALAQRYSLAAEQSARWQGYYRARLFQIRENPKSTLPRIGLVILWMQAGQPAKAKDELERIFALEPDHCEALGHLAEAERKLENFDAAKKAYDRALECAPDKVALRFNRAYLATLQGRTADARPDYQWITKSEHEADPRFLDAHLELARILRAEGESESSKRSYDRYVELGGKEPVAK